MQNESRSGVEKVGLDTSRSFFQMRCFVTSIIERPRHFYAFNTPETTTSSTPKITKSQFTLGRLEDTDLPGTGGNHTQLVVLADYPSLLQHLRDELADLLPEIKSAQRERLLQLLVQLQETEDDHP